MHGSIKLFLVFLKSQIGIHAGSKSRDTKRIYISKRFIPDPKFLQICLIVCERFILKDVDVDWRGFGGRDLVPTHRKIF
jgi:hypothetical protein